MTDKRQVLWGGRSTALHCSREHLASRPIDSVWFISLEGMCRFWLARDDKTSLAIEEAQVLSRDEAIAAIERIPARLKPIAVSADPILAELLRIVEQAHRARNRATAAIAADIESETDLFDRRNFRHESHA